MGNKPTKAVLSPRLKKKSIRSASYDVPMSRTDTQESTSSDNLNGSNPSVSDMEVSHRSRSRTNSKSSFSSNAETPNLKEQRKMSELSYGSDRVRRNLPMDRKAYQRRLSLRGTSSEPNRNQKPELCRYLKSHENLNASKSPKMMSKRKHLETTLNEQKELLEMFQIPLEKPIYVRLKPTFDTPQKDNLITSYVVTVWIKYLPFKKMRELKQAFEADISFSEATSYAPKEKNFENNNNIKKENIIRAHTWSGKTTNIDITENAITLQGTFVNPDLGTLDYLKFELSLNPMITNIGQKLMMFAQESSLLGISDPALHSKDVRMTGWFLFRDTRDKTSDKNLVWKAFVDTKTFGTTEKLNDILHMTKISKR